MIEEALVLMDYQHGICRGEMGQSSGLADRVAARHVLGNARRCLAAARQVGSTVVHVRVAFDVDYVNRLNRSPRFARYEASRLLADGTEDAEICPEVSPIAGELVVTKGCVDPFIGTPLMEHLIGRGVRRLYLGGVATHMVVESAVRHASDSGFDVTVLEDLCAAHDDELHDYAVRNILPGFAEVRSAAYFVTALQSGQGQ